LFLTIGAFSLYQCQKTNDLSNAQGAASSNLTSSSQSSGERDATTPAVVVSDGKLKFKDMEAFDSVYLQLESNTVAQNLAWNQSLGFKSIMHYYYKAVEETTCDGCANAPALPSEFVGKVIETPESIEPLLQYGTTSWLLNTNGQYEIGGSMIHLTATHMVTLLNPSAQLLNTALTTLTSNESLGVDVHTTMTKVDLACCDDKKDAPGVYSSNGNQKISQARTWFADMSGTYVQSNLTTGYKLKYVYGFDLKHERKYPTWKIYKTDWLIKQRIVAVWKGKAFANPNGVAVLPNSKFVNINTHFTWGNDGEVHSSTTMINAGVSKNVFDSRRHCLGCHKLDVKATKSGLQTSTECELEGQCN
jgi:hypothetical protein